MKREKDSDDWPLSISIVVFVLWFVLFVVLRIVWLVLQLVGWLARLVLEGLAGESRIN